MGWFKPPPPDLGWSLPRKLPPRTIPSRIGEANIVLNLLMHHGSRNILRDYSPYRNDGRLSGGYKWTDEGIRTWAVEFDGVSGLGEVPHSASLMPSTKVSVLAWLYLIAPHATAECDVIGKATNYTGYALCIRPNRSLLARYGGLGDTWDFTPSYILSLYTWYFAVTTHDGTYDRLFVNGVEITPATPVTSPLKANTASVIMARHYSIGWFMNIIIALPRVYGELALSATKIASIFEEERVLFGV